MILRRQARDLTGLSRSMSYTGRRDATVSVVTAAAIPETRSGPLRNLPGWRQCRDGFREET